MNIFKTFSFYFAIFGYIVAIAFFKMTEKPDRPVAYIQKPTVCPYKNCIAAYGIVEALNDNIKIGPAQEGVVTKIWVQLGDHVQKGDSLYQMDTRPLKARLGVQKANKEVAEAVLKKEQERLLLLQEIENPKAISRQDLQIAMNDVQIALAKAKYAEAEIMQTQDLIDRLTVRAPINGTVLQKNISEGEYFSPNEPAVILGDLHRLQLRVSIDEQLAAKFKKNSPAVAFPKGNTALSIPLEFIRIKPLIVPKKSLTGKPVERVDTRVLEVYYQLKEPADYPVYPGQQMDVYIEAQKTEQQEKRV